MVSVPTNAADLGRRVWNEFREDDVTGESAKLAYYAFLALPPSLLVLFALTGFFGGPNSAAWITANLEAALPTSASGLVQNFVQEVVNEKAPGPFSIGLLIALWASSNVFMALGDSMDMAYDVVTTRSWVRRRAIAVGVMFVFAILFLGGSAVLLAGPSIINAIGLGSVAKAIWSVLIWPLAFVLIVSAFWVVYYVLPDRDQSAYKVTLAKAAAAAALAWVIATALFRIYITNFGSYSETYGLLGAVIVLLLWLYVTGVVVLTGGELASEMDDPS